MKTRTLQGCSLLFLGTVAVAIAADPDYIRKIGHDVFYLHELVTLSEQDQIPPELQRRN